MKHLVLCPCMHALESHTDDGCAGETFRPGCACRRNGHEALEAAIKAAATEPWRAPESMERPSPDQQA